MTDAARDSTKRTTWALRGFGALIDLAVAATAVPMLGMMAGAMVGSSDGPPGPWDEALLITGLAVIVSPLAAIPAGWLLGRRGWRWAVTAFAVPPALMVMFLALTVSLT